MQCFSVVIDGKKKFEVEHFIPYGTQLHVSRYSLVYRKLTELLQLCSVDDSDVILLKVYFSGFMVKFLTLFLVK